MGKNRLEMKKLSKENRINVAETKMVETGYFEETETDKHLELASSVERQSERTNDWVDHALKN